MGVLLKDRPNEVCDDNLGAAKIMDVSKTPIYCPQKEMTQTNDGYCSIAEANAVNCQAQESYANTTPQLEFCRELAMQMLENRIGVDGAVVHSLIRARKCGREGKASAHGLCTCPNFTGG